MGAIGLGAIGEAAGQPRLFRDRHFADVLRHLEEAEGADAGMYDEEPEAPASMSEDKLLTNQIETKTHMSVTHRMAPSRVPS